MSAAELMADLNRRQKEYHAEFERLTRKHREALDAIRVIRENAAARQPDLMQLSLLVADEREAGNGCRDDLELLQPVDQNAEQSRRPAHPTRPAADARGRTTGRREPAVAWASGRATRRGDAERRAARRWGRRSSRRRPLTTRCGRILAEMMRGETLADAIAALSAISEEAGHELNEATRKALEAELQQV